MAKYNMGNSKVFFNGERYDLLNGCISLGSGKRYYNPVVMRFISPDRHSPFGKGGINNYIYCMNDPINDTDPSGNFSMKTILESFVLFSGVILNVSLLAATLPINLISIATAVCIVAALSNTTALALTGGMSKTQAHTHDVLGWSVFALGILSLSASITPIASRVFDQTRIIFKNLKNFNYKISLLKTEGLGGLGSKLAAKKMATPSNATSDHPILTDTDSDQCLYLYRGIGKGHPQEENARLGKVYPSKLSAKGKPDEHNLGSVALTPYTSWSADPDVARRFAGNEGVILRVKTSQPQKDDEWSWHISPDEYWEKEVLLKGIRIKDVEVFRPN